MAGMLSENLKVLICCFYFQEHTSHRRFINRDLREAAREILIARGDPYQPSATVDFLACIIKIYFLAGPEDLKFLLWNTDKNLQLLANKNLQLLEWNAKLKCQDNLCCSNMAFL